MKAYVGDGLAADFYREIAAYLDADTRSARARHAEPAPATASSSSTQVREAIEADPRVGGRLALWGRRLMGEALSQAQMVVAERDVLTAVLVGACRPPGWTSPRSAGCSPASPRPTPRAWPSSDSRLSPAARWARSDVGADSSVG